MLNPEKRFFIPKIIILCVFIVIAVGIPAATIKASTKTSQRTLLKNTIHYCEKLNHSEYTSNTWADFQKELEKAKTVCQKKKCTDETITSEKDKLEKAKADMIFVNSTDAGNPLVYRDLTADQIVHEMGTGWNLGNTMDGNNSFTPSETTWQHVVTTKALIKKVHDLGFNTIRIPVTWGNFIDDGNDYKIRDEWISRVQDIVDYAISQDMYVIINIHHDGTDQSGWLSISDENIDPVYEKFEHVWRNIANRFKDYDEHLIFESMNEVGSNNSSANDTKIINNLNQIFVNVVRSTGSNNSRRWLSVPGRFTSIDAMTNESIGFKVPVDSVKNRIFVAAHSYDFAFGLVSTMYTDTYSCNSANYLVQDLKRMYTSFSSKGIPVIIGEYGAGNKNNTIDRAYYYEVIAKICSRYGMVPCAWDTGEYDLSADPADYSMALIDRATLKEVRPAVTDGILRGTHFPLVSDDCSKVVKNPAIIKITDLSLSSTNLSMTIGDSEKITEEITPKDTNDVTLWETADPTVATVYDGFVRARGIGTTTLTVTSRSGSVQKKVTVTVNALGSLKPCTSIETDNTSYNLAKDGYAYIKTSLKPVDTDDYLTYKSSDESVATVSTLGKIVGCGIGTATITITASNGLVKTIPVTVSENKAEATTELSLALNVYYNDKDNKYYSNEVGKPITITGNGQYTVTFDCNTDLSIKAVKAGVSSLKNMCAIYIKDYNTTLGKTNKSPLVSCDIK